MDIVLSSARLALRRFTPDDGDLLTELDSDPEVMRYLTGGETTPREVIEEQTLPEVLALYDSDPAFGFLAAFERATEDFVGWFELRLPDDEPAARRARVYELGYRLRRKYWGRGYATEMSRLLLDHAFTEFGARRVFATTMAVNAASRRVLAKIGMSYVGTYFPDLPPIPGAKHGDVVYAVSSTTWASRKNPQED